MLPNVNALSFEYWRYERTLQTLPALDPKGLIAPGLIGGWCIHHRVASVPSVLRLVKKMLPNVNVQVFNIGIDFCAPA